MRMRDDLCRLPVTPNPLKMRKSELVPAHKGHAARGLSVQIAPRTAMRAAAKPARASDDHALLVSPQNALLIELAQARAAG